MPTIRPIDATEWPVFSDYELVHVQNDAQVHPCIAPTADATIVRRLDLTSWPTRTDALKSAIRCVSWRTKKAGREALSKAEAGAWGLGQVHADELLTHAREYGLFGIGPARIVRLIQDMPSGNSVYWWRTAGRLRYISSDFPGEFGSPAVVTSDPHGPHFNGVEWEFGRDSESDATTFPLGSDDWWIHYVEPIDSITRFLGDIATHAETNHYIHRLLDDAFIELPSPTRIASKTREAASIPLSDIRLRGVSAASMLAATVMQGGLDGWDVCAFRGCRRPFKKERRNQEYCSNNGRCRASEFGYLKRERREVKTHDA